MNVETAKDDRRPLDAAKGKERDCPLERPERMQSGYTLRSAPQDSFRLLTLEQYYNPVMWFEAITCVGLCYSSDEKATQSNS